jgi:hypothetical protein
MDGGYDCTTVIISMGDIFESLKINYVASDSDVGKQGIFRNDIKDSAGLGVERPFPQNSFIAKAYNQNVLAGIVTELYQISLIKFGVTSNFIEENLSLSNTGGGLTGFLAGLLSSATAATPSAAPGTPETPGGSNTPSGIEYPISKAPTGLIKTSQGNVAISTNKSAPALIVFGGIDVGGRKSGDYMWDYMGNLTSKYHIFVANNAKINGSTGYNEFISTLSKNGITPSQQILYLFSGGYSPGMNILPTKADAFTSIFLVDIWMGNTNVESFYKDIVSKYKAKTKYFYTSFGAQNAEARNAIANGAGFSNKQSDDTHMNTNKTALQYL